MGGHERELIVEFEFVCVCVRVVFVLVLVCVCLCAAFTHDRAYVWRACKLGSHTRMYAVVQERERETLTQHN